MRTQELMNECSSCTQTKPTCIYLYLALDIQCRLWGILLLICCSLEATLCKWESTIIWLYIYLLTISGVFRCILTNGCRSSRRLKELRTFSLKSRIPSRNQVREKVRRWRWNQAIAPSSSTVASISTRSNPRSGNITCTRMCGPRLTSVTWRTETQPRTWTLLALIKVILWLVPRVVSL